MTILKCAECGWEQDTDAKWVLCPNCECDKWVVVQQVTDDEGEE